MDALSLYDLNALVRRSLEQCLPDEYWVQAELSEVRVHPATGHCYVEFVQKDPRSNNLVAKARGVIWNNVFRLLRPYFEESTGQVFTAGIKVLVQVSVGFHELYGFSLTVHDIDPTYTLGDAAREQGISLMTYPGIYPYYLKNVLLPAMETAMGGPQAFSQITSYQADSILGTQALDILKIFERLADEGYILPGSVALNHTQSQQEQMNDHALFIPVGTWIESEMADSPRAEGYSFAMAPAPAMEAGQPRYCWVAMETMSIPAAAKNPDLAREFLRFLYTDSSVELFAEKANAVGATKNALDLAKDYITPGMYQMYSILNEKDVIPTVIAFDTQAQGSKIVLEDEMWNPASDVMNGTMTAEEWGQHIEDTFAAIRAELADAAS